MSRIKLSNKLILNLGSLWFCIQQIHIKSTCNVIVFNGWNRSYYIEVKINDCVLLSLNIGLFLLKTLNVLDLNNFQTRTTVFIVSLKYMWYVFAFMTYFCLKLMTLFFNRTWTLWRRQMFTKIISFFQIWFLIKFMKWCFIHTL